MGEGVLHEQAREGVFWHWMLLGRRAQVLADARGGLDDGRLRGGLHAEPDVQGGVLRPHRAHGGRPGGLRSARSVVRRPAPGLLGEPRPDAGDAAGRIPCPATPFRSDRPYP